MILFKGLENIVSFLTESVCHFISTPLGACPRVTLSLRTLSLTATDGPCFVSVENDLCAVTSASSGSSALCTAEPSVRMMAMTAAALKKQTEAPAKPLPKPRALPAELSELESRVRETLGVRATLTGSAKKGKIVLQYYSQEELEHLNELLMQLGEQQ